MEFVASAFRVMSSGPKVQDLGFHSLGFYSLGFHSLGFSPVRDRPGNRAGDWYRKEITS